MLIAGPAPADTDFVKVSYWQGQGIFHNLTCDTSGTGADLGVQNDLEVEGDIYTDSIKGSTANSDLTVTPDGTGVAVIGNVGDTELGDGTERDMFPSTDLKINLGKSANRFNNLYLGGALIQPVATTTVDITLTSAHRRIRCDCASRSIRVTLPAASGNKGLTYSIKKVDVSANAMTIVGNGTDTIDLGSEAVESTPQASITVTSDGVSDWEID
jgi:hypothetical protein